MIQVPIFLAGLMPFLFGLGVFFPPFGQRRFVWALLCASTLPAFLFYQWWAAPVSALLGGS